MVPTYGRHVFVFKFSWEWLQTNNSKKFNDFIFFFSKLTLLHTSSWWRCRSTDWYRSLSFYSHSFLDFFLDFNRLWYHHLFFCCFLNYTRFDFLDVFCGNVASVFGICTSSIIITKNTEITVINDARQSTVPEFASVTAKQWFQVEVELEDGTRATVVRGELIKVIQHNIYYSLNKFTNDIYRFTSHSTNLCLSC
jgi:hypothetical protein